MNPIPLKHEGNGVFRAIYPKRCADIPVGVAAWQQVEVRSSESHRHYFACIADGWGNLPEALADEHPSPEHLRHFALIKAGYCTETKVVCATNGDALMLASYVSRSDTYALVNVMGRVVTIWRAESQSVKAMGGKKFQASKEAVLRVISELIGADAAQGGMAA
ncbi:MAG: hypothetical protein H0X01_02055 [Nitrospira sp.]|nr:hypothetical protein [Nitrospira sp.]